MIELEGIMFFFQEVNGLDKIVIQSTTQSREKTMKTIQKWKEDSKKYNDLMNANNQQVKDNISTTEIYQKNKTLREKLKKTKEYILQPNEVNPIARDRILKILNEDSEEKE